MNVREIALRLLDEYELSGKYVNLSLSSHIADTLSSGERGFLTALLYTSVERKLTFDYYVSALSKRSTDKIDIHALNILRLGFAQLLYFDFVPDYAAVNETVKLARGSERSFVNGVLRAAVRAKESEGLPLPDRKKNEARYLSVAYSFPLPLCKKFISIFGASDTEAMLCHFNEASYTDLTVNLSRVSKEELLASLEARGIFAKASDLAPLGIRIPSSVNPTSLPGFSDGHFFVQDAASSLSCSVLGVRAGDRVIDVCACPGGKSFAAAMLAGDTGEVYSFDLHKSKLSLIDEGVSRLGFTNLRVQARDALTPDDSLFGTADRVICDVPCSGLGVLGKKADMRYRDMNSVSELPKLQSEILECSSRYLKVGGVLVYSTCTLNPEENEGVVEKFLSSHPEMEYAPFDLHGKSYNSYTVLPHKTGTDGFFIARLKRIG